MVLSSTKHEEYRICGKVPGQQGATVRRVLCWVPELRRLLLGAAASIDLVCSLLGVSCMGVPPPVPLPLVSSIESEARNGATRRFS
jgi:hypothetical protein